MIEFISPTAYKPGTLSALLQTSYVALQMREGLDWEKFVKGFDEFDASVYADPRIANCTFISVVEGKPIGLASFDPRQKPAYGDIGHNCILPTVQGKGYGRVQMEEVLRRLRERGIHTARVTTGADPFFEPAQRMYESCGFTETRRFTSETYPFWEMIEYEMKL